MWWSRSIRTRRCSRTSGMRRRPRRPRAARRASHHRTASLQGRSKSPPRTWPMPADVDVEGPDGKTYSFPDGTDKAAAIRYFKAKGITGYTMQHSEAERATAAAAPPPKVAKPSVAMHPSYLIGDPNADATPQSMGEVAKGMARNVYQVSAPGIAASLAHKFAPGALSKSGVPHGESFERNAAPLKELPGQIVENAAYAAIPEGGVEAE